MTTTLPQSLSTPILKKLLIHSPRHLKNLSVTQLHALAFEIYENYDIREWQWSQMRRACDDIVRISTIDDIILDYIIKREENDDVMTDMEQPSSFFPAEFILENMQQSEDEDMLEQCDYDFSFIFVFLMHNVDVLVLMEKMFRYFGMRRDENVQTLPSNSVSWEYASFREFLERIIQEEHLFERLISFLQREQHRKHHPKRRDIWQWVCRLLNDYCTHQLQQHFGPHNASKSHTQISSSSCPPYYSLQSSHTFTRLHSLSALCSVTQNAARSISDTNAPSPHDLLEQIQIEHNLTQIFAKWSSAQMQDYLLSSESNLTFDEIMCGVSFSPPLMFCCTALLIRLNQQGPQAISSFVLSHPHLIRRYVLTCRKMVRRVMSFSERNAETSDPIKSNLFLFVDAMQLLSKHASTEVKASDLVLKALILLWLFNQCTQDIVTKSCISVVTQRVEEIYFNSGRVEYTSMELEELIYCLSQYSRLMVNSANARDAHLFFFEYCQEKSIEVLDLVYVVLGHIFTQRDIPNYFPRIKISGEVPPTLSVHSVDEYVDSSLPDALFVAMKHVGTVLSSGNTHSLPSRIFFTQKYLHHALSSYLQQEKFSLTTLQPALASLWRTYMSNLIAMLSTHLRINEIAQSRSDLVLDQCNLNATVLILAHVLLNTGKNQLATYIPDSANALSSGSKMQLDMLKKNVPVQLLEGLDKSLDIISATKIVFSSDAALLKEMLLQMIESCAYVAEFIVLRVVSAFGRLHSTNSSIQRVQQCMGDEASFLRYLSQLAKIQLPEREHSHLMVRVLMRCADKLPSDSIPLVVDHMTNCLPLEVWRVHTGNGTASKTIITQLLHALTHQQFATALQSQAFQQGFVPTLMQILFDEPQQRDTTTGEINFDYIFFLFDVLRTLLEKDSTSTNGGTMQRLFIPHVANLTQSMKKWYKNGMTKYLKSTESIHDLTDCFASLLRYMTLTLFSSTGTIRHPEQINPVLAVFFVTLHARQDTPREFHIFLETLLHLCQQNAAFRMSLAKTWPAMMKKVQLDNIGEESKLKYNSLLRVLGVKR